MPLSNPRLPILMLALLALFAWPHEVRSQDFSARLEQLELLSFSGTRQEIRAEIGKLEKILESAGPRDRARFTLLKARQAALEKRSDEAIEMLDSLLEQRSELEPEIELRALNLATNLLVFNDRFEEGFDYFRQALELAPGVEAAEMRAGTYSVAAEFHARIGEYATAIEYATQSLAQVDRNAAPRAHCVALERRARAHLGLEQLDRAVRDYRAAIELCEAIPDLIFAGGARIGLATALRAREKPLEAESALRRAMDELSRASFTEGELEARYRLADLLLDQARVDEAQRIMAPTPEWIEMPGSHGIRAEALRVLARLASMSGDRTAEYEYTRRSIRFLEQQSIRSRQMRFTLLMSAHDDRARDRELELLRSENLLAQLDRENRRQEELALTYGGFGAVVAGILLLALLIKAARDRQQFQRLSQRDGLTGLYNHTRFFELAQQAFQRARQSAMPFSLIVTDIDLFKQVNDEHGHLVGDGVLARVGARLRDAFGPDAIIGRLGGEEFGIALSDCDIDTAVARIEHFRATLNRQRSDDDEVTITMSFGVAELAHEQTLDVLYAHADQALYDAKDAGRNRVITVARLDLGGREFVT